MLDLDALERKLKEEADKEIRKFRNKSKAEQERDMYKTYRGKPDVGTAIGGMKTMAYDVVKGIRKVRDKLK